MSCPNCFLTGVPTPYHCISCHLLMCSNCVSFALHCGNHVCFECEQHKCTESRCTIKLLVNMPIRELLLVYGGETLSGQNWEKMGEPYDPESIRITKEDITGVPQYTNPFSFPEILEVRVYDVDDYKALSKWIWGRIRLANETAKNFTEYVSRIEKMSTEEFICWYHHRCLHRDRSFEGNVFQGRITRISGVNGVDRLQRLKEELCLVNEKFSVEEESSIPK